MSSMREFVKSIGKFVILGLIYPYQYRKYSSLPLERKKVVFVEVRGEEGFVGASMRQVFDRVAADGSWNIRCHFLREGVGSRKENLRRTMEMLKDVATAGYVFLSEANNAFSRFEKRPETKVIQLWHGCGAFKKFGFSTAGLRFGSSCRQQEKYPLYHNLDLVTVSSPEVIWAYREAMGVDEGIIRATGISRTDVFFDDEYVKAAVKKVKEAVPAIGERKILLYAPTFRGDVSRAQAPRMPDMEYMRSRLAGRYVVLMKQHPFVKNRPAVPESCRNFLFDVTDSLAIDELICAADMCISDYSSLVFEYALFERPMIFFAYDIDSYDDWRGFYYDYDELTPGPVVKTTEELVRDIEKFEKTFDAAEVRAFAGRFMSACDGKATDRILEWAGMEG